MACWQTGDLLDVLDAGAMSNPMFRLKGPAMQASTLPGPPASCVEKDSGLAGARYPPPNGLRGTGACTKSGLGACIRSCACPPFRARAGVCALARDKTRTHTRLGVRGHPSETVGSAVAWAPPPALARLSCQVWPAGESLLEGGGWRGQ